MTQRPIFVAVVCFAALSIGSAQLPKATHAGECETKNWSWKPNDPNGPQAWAQNYPSYCAQGQQSPINLTSNGSSLGPFQVHYQPFTGKVLNNGYKVTVNVPTPGAGGYIEIDGKRFNLVEFHFHVQSEHTVKSHQFALEAHLVHENAEDASEKAAIAILYDLSKAGKNLLVEEVIGKATLTCGSPNSAQIDPRQLFPGGTVQGTYYAYSGSLTNPDCIPIAHFLVADTPSAVDAATVRRLQQIVAGFRNNVGNESNNRPTQPLLNPQAVNHRTAVDPLGGAPRKAKANLAPN